MALARIRKNDTVMIITGRERGKTGKILRILTDRERVIVERLNLQKRHTKPRGAQNPGGIVEKEGSIHISNVALWSEKQQRAIKVKIVVNEAGKKSRVDKKTGEILPEPPM
jgi:large subunit ribosomal protein L24